MYKISFTVVYPSIKLHSHKQENRGSVEYRTDMAEILTRPEFVNLVSPITARVCKMMFSVVPVCRCVRLCVCPSTRPVPLKAYT